MKHKHYWHIVRLTDYFKKDRCDCGAIRQHDRLKGKSALK